MFEKIAKYLAEQLDIAVEDITPETTFESLGIDSLDCSASWRGPTAIRWASTPWTRWKW